MTKVNSSLLQALVPLLRDVEQFIEERHTQVRGIGCEACPLVARVRSFRADLAREASAPTHYSESCSACGYAGTIRIPDGGSVELQDCPICGESMEYSVYNPESVKAQPHLYQPVTTTVGTVCLHCKELADSPAHYRLFTGAVA